MKKITFVAVSLCLSIFISGTVNARENVDPNDPCDVTVCMYGEVTGHSQQECRSAVRKFFSMNAFKKHHRFSPGKTLDMRRQFLGQCKSADPDAVSQILSRYGRVRG
ncbi:conjugal transfer protein [Citrobacter amalonaticus]|uniref:conjugal transfer protein n=1 Tax=Citrobacter amalonaticus TaxID=35703 RepID=UPI001A2D6901|nr:conjugal transfer protein [Citrobacter amalonaticus]HDQ2811401.1 conjugal transfer protein [Citrobacter amalonaticus]